MKPGSSWKYSSTRRMWKFCFSIGCLAAVGLLSHLTFAQAQTPQIGLLTGPTTSTSFRMGQELSTLTSNNGLDLLVKASTGSLENIQRLMSQEKAALAIMQSDALEFLGRATDPTVEQMASQLRLLFPLYSAEVHLLTHYTIQDFRGLAGKQVIIGQPGSGSWLTARHLLHQLNIKPSTLIDNLSPVHGLQAVLTGQADAFFHVGGKPVTLFVNMQDLTQDPRYATLFDHVHFVPVPTDHLQHTYQVASIGPDDYTWVRTPVATVAVHMLLVSFDFSQHRTPYYRKRCTQVGSLSRILYKNLVTLKRTGHSKWKEVDLTTQPAIWRYDRCSQAIRRTLAHTHTLQKEFNAILKQKHRP